MEEYSFKEKVSVFIKQNIITIIILAISIVFIFRDAGTIGKTGKTIIEIIGSGTVNFIMGIMIKLLLRRQGLQKGQSDLHYLKKLNLYGQKLENNGNKIPEIRKYCKRKNEERLKEKQIEYLRKYAISYDDFIKGKYDGSIDDIKDKKEVKKMKKKQKIVNRCRKKKIYKLTIYNLLNASRSRRSNKEVMKANTNVYETSRLGNNILISILIATIFSYYTIYPEQLNVVSILWNTIQMLIYLSMAVLEYFNAYNYVTQDMGSKINYVISCFDEFETLEKKGYFKEDEPESEVYINE